jgi:hypothetical protein
MRKVTVKGLFLKIEVNRSIAMFLVRGMLPGESYSSCATSVVDEDPIACRKTGVPVRSTVFLRSMVCEAASGEGREGGGNETHCISALLNISTYVLLKMHRDAMDTMGDFF